MVHNLCPTTIASKRLCQVRFEYQKGVPILIVGDSSALTMIDYEASQVQRWPIRMVRRRLYLIKVGMVPQARLERALLSEQDFESSASTNSTTGAQQSRANPSERRPL